MQTLKTPTRVIALVLTTLLLSPLGSLSAGNDIIHCFGTAPGFALGDWGVVPEPDPAALLGLGLMGMGWARRKSV